MNPEELRERYALVTRLYTAVMDLDVDERRTYLDRECRTDPALREEVEAMLHADEQLPEILHTGVFYQRTDLVDRAPAPERVGAFHLESRIGEGGMGVVYRGQQRSPVQRNVAVKILRTGIDSERLRDRFRIECQALAEMSHENVARVYDAGQTDDGRPFLVMELIEGPPIHEYCDSNRLTIRQRVELLVQVARGVQHAHQRAIVHRDLKPSNVLVADDTGQPVPKLIDFGIAKLTERPSDGPQLHTIVGEMLCTPEYMSPEQTNPFSSQVDTRTDVYGLGVLAYQLLSGMTPFGDCRLEESSFDEICATVRTRIPRPPSDVLRRSGAALDELAAQRGTSRSAITRELSRDLDSIVLRCLAKKPDDRYATALDFADDLERWLRGAPVEARDAGLLYRAARFMGRNKVGVTLATAAVGTLLAFTAMLGIQNRQLKYERQAVADQAYAAEQTQDLALRLLELADEDLDTDSKIAVVDKALDAIEPVFQRQPKMRTDFIGDLMSVVCSSDDVCSALYHAIWTSLARAPRHDPRVLALKAQQYSGWMTPNREPALQQAVADAERALGADDVTTLRLQAALASLQHRTKRLEEALDTRTQVVAGFEKALGPLDILTLNSRAALAAIYMDLDQMDRAEVILTETLRQFDEGFGPAAPGQHVIDQLSGDPRRVALNASYNLATIHINQKRFDQGLQQLRFAVDRGFELVFMQSDGEIIARRDAFLHEGAFTHLYGMPTFETMFGEEGYIRYIELADAALWDNRYEEALEHLSAAVERGYDGALIETHPWFYEFRERPEFQEFVAQFKRSP